MDGRAFGKQASGSAKRGPWLEQSAPAVGQLLGVLHAAAGAVQTRNEDAQSPRSNQKKDFTPFSAGSAAPDGLRGLLGRGQDSPSRGKQPHLPSFFQAV